MTVARLIPAVRLIAVCESPFSPDATTSWYFARRRCRFAAFTRSDLRGGESPSAVRSEIGPPRFEGIDSRCSGAGTAEWIVRW